MEFLGLAVSSLAGGEDVIASLALSGEKIKKLLELARVIFGQNAAALSTLQKLEGKLPFSQTASMSRFGRAALKPVF